MRFDFFFSLSPWPLPKVMYAYEAYMYQRNFKKVILGFYAFKLLYVVAYTLNDGEYDGWFDGLGSLYKYSDAKELDVVSVVLGDFLLAFLGASIAWIQVMFLTKYSLFYDAPSSPDGTFTTTKGRYRYVPMTFSFKTAEQWKTRIDRAYLAKRVNAEIRNESSVSSIIKTGKPFRETDRNKSSKVERRCYNRYGCCCLERGEKDSVGCNGWRKKMRREYGLLPFCNITGSKGCDDKWKYRKMYWIQAFQLFMLGAPGTIAFTLNRNDKFSGGVMTYALIHVGMTFVFYLWNRYYEDKYYELEKGWFTDRRNPLTTYEDLFPPTNDDCAKTIPFFPSDPIRGWNDYNLLYVLKLFTFLHFSALHVWEFWYPTFLVYASCCVSISVVSMLCIAVLSGPGGTSVLLFFLRVTATSKRKLTNDHS